MASGDQRGRAASVAETGVRPSSRTRESQPPALRGREGQPSGIEAFPRLITVAREYGAGAARISGRVAAELGLQLWDYEIISHLARKADTDLGVIRDIDERHRDLLDDVIATSLHGARITGSRYRALLTRTIAELAERGGAVIVGRGANFLVRAEDALRVRIVCPLRERIDRYARRAQVEWVRAERIVRTKDEERERFVRQLCGETSADPGAYDLTLNTAELSEETAATLIVTAYRSRFRTQTTREGERANERRSISATW